MAFGQSLREAREAAKISQMALAEAAGLHPTYVSSVERGHRNVGLVNIVRLALGVGVPPAHLLDAMILFDS